MLERLHEQLTGVLAVATVRDELAQHRVVRRADHLPGLERVIDPEDAGEGHRTIDAVPAWGRKSWKGSSA